MSSGCPQPDRVARNVWSILINCGVTLLICVWQAIRPDVPHYRQGWQDILSQRTRLILLAIFVPEWTVGTAARERWHARHKVMHFRVKDYGWSMTHSYFAEMGGFLHTDNEGYRNTIDSLQFLDLCERNQIANPVITVKEIQARSKSDRLAKVIFAIQLFWFMLQVVVRVSRHLAVTLVELDTVCMIILTILLLVLWWDKPLRPEYPHVFYSPQAIKPYPESLSAVSKHWESEPSYLSTLVIRLTRTQKTRQVPTAEEISLVATGPPRTGLRAVIEEMDGEDIMRISLLVAWLILGIMHLTAWNYDFPTNAEKIIWRAASLVLMGGPLVVIISVGSALILEMIGWYEENVIKHMRAALIYTFPFGVMSRVFLVVLMLVSLRALPCSTHDTVSWIAYIPHI